jgi:hypothetical protein
MSRVVILLILFLVILQNKILGNGLLPDDDGYSKNVMFVEAGGNGLGFSLNYEGFFSRKVGIRLGVGSLLIYGLSFPVMLNYYVGKDNNKLELGAGIVRFNGGADDSIFGDEATTLLGFTIGLRHQKQFKGVVVRVSFTPLYNPEKDRFIPFGGLSVGFTF